MYKEQATTFLARNSEKRNENIRVQSQMFTDMTTVFAIFVTVFSCARMGENSGFVYTLSKRWPESHNTSHIEEGSAKTLQYQVL